MELKYNRKKRRDFVGNQNVVQPVEASDLLIQYIFLPRRRGSVLHWNPLFEAEIFVLLSSPFIIAWWGQHFHSFVNVRVDGDSL